MIMAFLHDGSFPHWLVYNDHIVNQIINTLVGAILGIVVVGAILRPTLLRGLKVIKHEWSEHKRLLGARPVACPVCKGVGTVHIDFYPKATSAYNPRTGHTTCRTCGGKGIVTAANTEPEV
jgi:hypothetical protein